MFTLEELQVARNVDGVYFLYNENKELVYIGKSRNIYLRILEHKFENKKKFDFFKMTGTSREIFTDLLEVCLIDIYSKKANLYNKTRLNTSFDNFYYHLPSSVKDEVRLESIYSAVRRLSYYIEFDNNFNGRYKPDEAVIEPNKALNVAIKTAVGE